MTLGRWTVCKRDGVWRVIDPSESWNDTYPSLADAHTYATQNAVADILYQPGGLTCLTELLEAAQ